MRKKNEFWRGVEGVTMIDHGEWSDPELRFGNVVCGYYEVEDTMWWKFMYEVNPANPDDCDDEFNKFCCENRDLVIELIYDCQAPDNRWYLTEYMMEAVNDEINYEQEELLKEVAWDDDDSGKLEEMKKMLVPIMKKFEKKYGLEDLGEDWWKHDYRFYKGHCGMPNANFESLLDLVQYWYQ